MLRGPKHVWEGATQKGWPICALTNTRLFLWHRELVGNAVIQRPGSCVTPVDLERVNRSVAAGFSKLV